MDEPVGSFSLVKDDDFYHCKADIGTVIVQFSSSLCKAPYHSNVKCYTDLGQLNCGVFRPQVHLILITKKTGTSVEQTSGFNHEYQ